MGANLGALRGASARKKGAAAAPTPFSLEFGRTPWGNDYIQTATAPTGGTLFSIWSRIPDDIASFPFSRGNQEIYQLHSTNWHVRCIVGNCSAANAGDTNCWYNANSMLLVDGGAVGEANNTYVGDYSWMGEGGHTVAELQGFNFSAWYVRNTGSAFELVLWLRFAGGPLLGPFTSTVTHTEIRTTVVAGGTGWQQANADALVFDANPLYFTIAPDTGFNTHARMEAVAAQPTDAHVLAVSNAINTPDATAWGDWPLIWDTNDNVPVLTDRSGNGRTLSVRGGGALHQGPVAALT
jgi:hypothetical protein